MKGFQRLISGVLALCLMLTLVPVTAWAEETVPEATVVETTEAATEAAERTAVPTEAEPTEGTTMPTEMKTEATEEIVVVETVENASRDAAYAIVASGTCGDNLTWELDEDGVLTVFGNGPMDDDGESDPAWMEYADQILTVIIEDGVTTVANSAFQSYYKNLTSVTIPGSVTSIGNCAFHTCDNLSSVLLQEGLNSIGEGAFGGCTNLVEITIPESVTSIGESAFSLCTSLSNIAIPQNVTSIGYGAFSHCYKLTNITIPKSVTSVEGEAFAGCSGLTEIIFEGNAPTIGQWAFNDVTATVYYSAGNDTWTEDVMQDYGGTLIWVATDENDGDDSGTEDTETAVASGTCGENLTWKLDEDGVLAISGTGDMENYDESDPSWLEYADQILSVAIEEGVTSIGNYAFYELVNLTHVAVSDSVTSIGEGAFYNCESLSDIEIPDSVTSMGDYVFSCCYSLTSATIPDGVSCIGVEMFDSCESLESVSIPDSVTSIEESAFSGCTSLSGVTIPDGVSSIGTGAFSACSSLSDVIIPNSVSTIGDSAFSGCYSLNSVTIGAGVISIGDCAFEECDSLSAVYITDISAWCSIDFVDATSNPLCYAENLYLNEELVTELIVPDDVTSIGSYAFYNCENLTIVTIPGSVATIGDSAFLIENDQTMIVFADNMPAFGESWLETGHRVFYPFGNDTWYEDELDGNYNWIPYDVDGPDKSAVEGGSCGENVMWVLDESGVLTISGSGDMDNYESSEDTPWEYYEGVISVVIEDGVTSIGNNAFNASVDLTSVSISDSVTTIGDYAFNQCETLPSVTIPAGITSIGICAFCFCDKLTNITFCGDAPAFGEDVFYGVTATVTYPDANTTWTEDMMQDYGGTLVWVCDHEHSYTGEITKPTCTEQGYTTYNCVCGGSYVSDYLDALGHDYQDGVCSRCGAIVDGLCGENLIWVLDDSGVLTISGTGPMPAFGSTGDSPWYEFRKMILGVVIESGVTSIESYAFYGCVSLTEITIPDSVTSIGSSAFESCTSLTEITIPDSVTSIITDTFRFCTSLTDITIPNSVTSIGAGAFWGCKSLMETTIPNSVTSIGYHAFRDCTSLTDITIPNSVTSIGNYAFCDCSTLMEINISDNVTSIGKAAFSGCSSLTDITIPNSVRSIGEHAFYECTSLMDIAISDNLTGIGDLTFYGCTSLTGIAIPDSVTSIGDSAFSGCTSLTDIIIANGVTSIGDSAFSGCTSLTKITIPDSVTSIGGYAFYDCTSLTDITISNSTKSIGHRAFYCCTSLKGINIPDSVTSIGVYAFSGCSSLTGMSIPDSVTSIGDHAFSGCTSLLEISISDSVTSIDTGTFYCCKSLKNITIPDSVASIGDYAFYDCTSLTNIIIPNSVTSIGDSGFSGCTSLVDITISDSVTSIGDYAFSGCTSLVDITISDSVTSIGVHAFSGCTSLTVVIIPASVTRIGDYAFSGCTSITDVYYGLGERDWNAIFPGNDNVYLIYATFHYYCDGPNGGSDDGDDESAISEGISVRYFRAWDAETQTAYWGEEPPMVEGLDLGSQVTEETDTSFLADVESLVGTYVLVETKARDDGMIAADFLLSIKPLVTKTGTVTEIGDTTITIDGITYTVPESAFPLLVEVGETVMYHLYKDELVGINGEGLGDTGTEDDTDDETASKANNVYYFNMWDEVSKTVQFGIVDQFVAKVTAQTDTTFLQNIESLLGTYVMVDIVQQDSIDELMYIKPVETRIGTVGGINGLEISVDNVNYTILDKSVVEAVQPDDFIMYHIYEGKIVALEVLQIMTGEVVSWNSTSQEVSIVLDDSDAAYGYILSPLCEEPTIELLNAIASGNTTIVTPVQFACDGQGFLYYAKKLHYEIKAYMPIPVGIVELGKETDILLDLYLGDNTVPAVNGYTVRIDDTDIVREIGSQGPDAWNNTWTYKFEGSGLGSTCITFIDNTNSENQLTIPITVGDDISYFRCSKVSHNLETVNGIHIANYTCTDNGNKTHNISFDAYNSWYSYAVVEVYDEKGKLEKVEPIHARSDSSGMKLLVDYIYYGFVEPFNTDIPWYAKESASRHTKINLENVPENAKIRITCDGEQSRYVTLYSGIDIFTDIVFLASSLDVGKEAKEKTIIALVKEVLENVPEQTLYAAVDSIGLAMTEGSTADSAAGVFKILYNMFKKVGIDFGTIIENVLESCGYAAIDTVVTYLIPEMEIASLVVSAANIGWKTTHWSMWTKGTGNLDILITDHNVVYNMINNNVGVTLQTGFDGNTVLDAYQVVDSVELQALPAVATENLENYQVYNITLREDGVECQPNGELEVRLPIPEGADGEKCSVYRLEENGERTLLLSNYVDGYLVFTTSHLSYYIVGERVKSATIDLLQDYLVLCVGKSTQLTVEVEPAELTPKVQWQVDDETTLSVDDSGIITAIAPGTAYVKVTLIDRGHTYTSTCRVDVSENLVVDGIQLGTTKVTSELYSTNYTELDILLMLPQNYPSGMFASQSAAMAQAGTENNGVAIEAARFTDDAIAKLFDISVLDDRRVQIVPTDYAVANPKEVAGKYTGTITVTVQGQEYISDALTLTVKKTVPKLKASVSAFNSFYSGQTQEIVIAGGTPTAIYENSARNTAKSKAIPAWLALEDDRLMLTEAAPQKNTAGKAYILVETEEWRIPAALTLSVKNSYKAPGLKLSASGVTMTALTENSDGVEMKLLCKNKKDTLEALDVTGITAPAGYTVSGFDLTDGSFTLKAEDGLKAGKIMLSVTFGSTKVTLPLTLTVKTAAVSLKLSAKTVTLNTAVSDSAAITVTATPKDYRIIDPTIRLTDAKGVDKLGSGELEIRYEDGRLLISATSDTPAGTSYKLYISAGGSKEALVTIKTIAKEPTVTLKASGSMDLSFPDRAAVVTATFKNYASGEIRDYTYSVTQMKGKTVETESAAEYFSVEREGSAFYIRCISDEVNTSSTYVLKLTLTLADGSTRDASVNLKVKRTAVKLKLSASKLTLNKTIGDSGSITVSCTTKGYDFITPVWKLMDKSGKNSAEGKLDVGYADGKLTVSVNESTEYGATYKLLVKADEYAPAASLTVTIPGETKSGVTVSLKVSGKLDVIRDGSSITVVPSYKNCAGDAEKQEEILIYSSFDGYAVPVNDLFHIEANGNGGYTITRAEGASLDHSLKYKVKVAAEFGDVHVESPLSSIKVTMGSAKLTLETEGNSLFAKDCKDRLEFHFTAKDAALNEVVRVDIKDAKYQNVFEILEYGNGQFALGFKDNTVESSLIGKTITLNLTVWLEDNETAKANTTVKLKLTVVK